jgi:hypothetical protein
MLLWGETAQGHIRAVIVVGPPPPDGEVLTLSNAGPIILGQPLVTNRPVEPLDLSILPWLSSLNVFKRGATFLSPCLNLAADVLRSVVAKPQTEQRIT